MKRAQTRPAVSLAYALTACCGWSIAACIPSQFTQVRDGAPDVQSSQDAARDAAMDGRTEDVLDGAALADAVDSTVADSMLDAQSDAGTDSSDSTSNDSTSNDGTSSDSAIDAAPDQGADAALDAPRDIAVDAAPDVAHDSGSVPDSAAGDATASDAGGAAPQPILPEPGAQLLSMQPSFRWIPAPGSTSSRVQICADRACSAGMVLSELTWTHTAAAEQTARLGTPLAAPGGRKFWRVIALPSNVASPSRSLYLSAPGSGTSVMTRVDLGFSTDINDDGCADLVTTARGAGGGRTDSRGGWWIFLGRRGGGYVESTPFATGIMPVGQFPSRVVAIGDVNGDGFPDIAIGGSTGGADYVTVLAGGATGSAVRVLSTHMGQNGVDFANLPVAIGDVNRDGYSDLGVMSYSDPTGRVDVYLGGPSGPSSIRTAGVTASGVGIYATRLGDVDNDGRSDLAMVATTMTSPEVQIYRGTPTASYFTRVRNVALPAGNVPWNARLLGDIDNNGTLDFGLSFIRSGMDRIELLEAADLSALLFERTVARTLTQATPQLFGASLAAIGDLNGDGFADFAAGAPGDFDHDTNASAANVRVFFGASTFASMASTSLELPMADRPTPAAGGRFGSHVGSMMDLDGDGDHELVIAADTAGAPGSTYQGYVYVYDYSAAMMAINPTPVRISIAGLYGSASGAHFGYGLPR